MYKVRKFYNVQKQDTAEFQSKDLYRGNNTEQTEWKLWSHIPDITDIVKQ
uniref:Uncharacterized protein n=1 Tax=Arion vulgaris TaxID=1028688 RepID=A0A0B7AUM2_9EUPU